MYAISTSAPGIIYIYLFLRICYIHLIQILTVIPAICLAFAHFWIIADIIASRHSHNKKNFLHKNHSHALYLTLLFSSFSFTYEPLHRIIHTKYYLLSVQSGKNCCFFVCISNTTFSNVSKIYLLLIMQPFFRRIKVPIHDVDLVHVKMKIMNSFQIRNYIFRVYNNNKKKLIICGEGHVIKSLIKTNIPSSSFAWEHWIVYCQDGFCCCFLLICGLVRFSCTRLKGEWYASYKVDRGPSSHFDLNFIMSCCHDLPI